MGNLKDKVIVALDNLTYETSFNLLERIKNDFSYIKIGMEYFYAYGPDKIYEIHDRFGLKIFLDLKIHDIPNTVSSAIKSLQNLPIIFLTTHVYGGEKMLMAAVESARQYLPNTNIVGVTHLTSLSQNEMNFLWNIKDDSLDKQIHNIIDLSRKAGINHFVSSAYEARMIKSHYEECTLICPGIRFKDEIDANQLGDQMRVQTPKEALNHGADFLVMGRSITQAAKLDKRIEQLSYD